MNKGLKTVLAVAVIATCAGVMAGPHHHHHHKPNNGVRLATDIVNLVGASLNLAAPRPAVVTIPAVVTPAIIGTTAHIVAPQVYHAPPPPPPPPRHHHHRPAPRRPHHGHRR